MALDNLVTIIMVQMKGQTMSLPSQLAKFEKDFPFYVTSSDTDKAPRLSPGSFKAAFPDIVFMRHRELNGHTWRAWWMFRNDEDFNTFKQWAANL